MEELEVAAVLITQGSRVLVVYNAKWGSFSLPMTKRRKWDDPNIPVAHREESWTTAAARAAAESLGRTVTGLEFLADVPRFGQGDRDGAWKRYHFQVFRLAVPAGTELRPGTVGEWLTVDELLDPARGPISPTAVELVPQAQVAAGEARKTLA